MRETNHVEGEEKVRQNEEEGGKWEDFVVSEILYGFYLFWTRKDF